VYELLQYFREAELAYKRAADMIRTRIANDSAQLNTNLEAALGDMLNYQAFFNLRPGNNREARELFKSSLALLKPLNEPQSLAFAYTHSGIVHWATGNFDDASKELSEGLSISHTLSQPWLKALSMGLLGGVFHDIGRYEEAYGLLSESIAIFRAMNDPYFILLIGSYYTRTAQALGRFSETDTVLRESLQIARESGNRWSIGLVLERMGAFAQVDDRWSLSWVLNDLSQLALTCHTVAEAERYAVEAIRVATEAGNHPSALNALVVLSMIRAKQNLNVPAMEMALQVLRHSSSTQDAKDRAEHIRLELELKLTRDEIKSINMQTQPDNFENFISPQNK
jgi:tetratricopeptide (TPR) repeat protein